MQFIVWRRRSDADIAVQQGITAAAGCQRHILIRPACRHGERPGAGDGAGGAAGAPLGEGKSRGEPGKTGDVAVGPGCCNSQAGSRSSGGGGPGAAVGYGDGTQRNGVRAPAERTGEGKGVFLTIERIPVGIGKCAGLAGGGVRETDDRGGRGAGAGQRTVDRDAGHCRCRRFPLAGPAVIRQYLAVGGAQRVQHPGLGSPEGIGGRIKLVAGYQGDRPYFDLHPELLVGEVGGNEGVY